MSPTKLNPISKFKVASPNPTKPKETLTSPTLKDTQVQVPILTSLQAQYDLHLGSNAYDFSLAAIQPKFFFQADVNNKSFKSNWFKKNTH